MKNNIQTNEQKFFVIRQQIPVQGLKNLYTLTLVNQEGYILHTYFAQEQNKLITSRILEKIPKEDNKQKYLVFLNFKISSQVQNSFVELNLQSFMDKSFEKDLEKKLEDNLLTSKNDKNEIFTTWYENFSAHENFNLKQVKPNQFIRTEITIQQSDNNFVIEKKDSIKTKTEGSFDTIKPNSNLLNLKEQITTDSAKTHFEEEEEKNDLFTKQQLFLLIKNAGKNNSENTNFKIESARLRLIYTMTLFSHLNTIQILELQKQDFQRHILAYKLIQDNPELKRDFDYFFTIKDSLYQSKKKSLSARNSRSYWVQVINEDFAFFQKQHLKTVQLTLKDLKPFYYRLIADNVPNVQVFQNITKCSEFIIRKYRIRIASNNCYEFDEFQISQKIFHFLGPLM